MTDQPSTQEQCPTCGQTEPYIFRYGSWAGSGGPMKEMPCPDPWHGSQDVEGGGRVGNHGERDAEGLTESNEAQDRGPFPSTTQEAEKALETIEEALNAWLPTAEHYMHKEPEEQLRAALAALRSLRTQHTEMQVELEQAYHDRTELEIGVKDNFVVIDRLTAERDEFHAERDALKAAWDRLHDLYTKDREEIERLKGELERGKQ